MSVDTINVYIDLSFTAQWTLTLAASIALIRLLKR